MSSALRHLSQIEPPVRFLRAVPNNVSYTYATDASMGQFLATNVVIGSGLNTIVKSATAPETASARASPALVRDLGRRVTIVDATPGSNLVRQVWIEVQGVNGSGSEGVPDEYPLYGTFWIRTFNAADGSPGIEWARLG